MQRYLALDGNKGEKEIDYAYDWNTTKYLDKELKTGLEIGDSMNTENIDDIRIQNKISSVGAVIKANDLNSHSSRMQRSVNNIRASVSSVSIEYRHGAYEVIEDGVSISVHESFAEAQWIKCMLDRG